MWIKNIRASSFNNAIFYGVVCVLSCVRLFCDPMDCSLLGSSVHGILQARIQKWVAISFFRSSWPMSPALAGGFFTTEPPGFYASHGLIEWWKIFKLEFLNFK